MRVSLTARDILLSPDYFPLKLEGSNVLFVRMSRQAYYHSIFTLPSRIVTDGDQAWSVPLADVVAMVESASERPKSASCIFQIAHCGSTLLSRALDFTDESLVIREPFILRQISAVSGAQNKEQKRKALAAIWGLLSRTYSDGQQVIVKANVPVNFSLPLLLENTPHLRGILLHIQFDDYLMAILKSDERRMWAKHVCLELTAEISQMCALPIEEFQHIEAWQAAALLWSGQIECFRRAGLDSQSLLQLDADSLFQEPLNALEICNQHLQLGVTSIALADCVSSSLFSSHAKDTSKSYSSQQRSSELLIQKKTFAAELTQAKRWAQEMGLATTF